MIFMQGECFFDCALACLEEETKSKIPNIPDLVHLHPCIEDILFQIPHRSCFAQSLGQCVLFLWGEFGWKKKLLLIYLCAYSCLLFSYPQNLKKMARNRYSPGRSTLEHSKVPTKFCRKTLTGF